MFDDRKTRALMIIIEKIIARHHQGYIYLDEESFKLFELVKGVLYAETEEGFQAAIAELGCAPETFKPSKPLLLSLVTTVQVPGAKRFVVADAFGPNNPAGIKFFLDDNFKKLFLGETEENVEPATIAIHRLERESRDPEIMAELGIDKKSKKGVLKLAHLYKLIEAQANGQAGPLHVNGYANKAYIKDEKDGDLWTVNAYRISFHREWRVDAYSVEPPFGWGAGYRVLSRK